VSRVWRCFADSLLGEHFDAHPYRLAAADPAGTRATFEPSLEAEHFVEMARDLANVHHIIQAAWSEGTGAGRCPDFGMYARARFSLLTRVFQTCDSSTMVPVVDLLNHHSTSPGVSWRWDPEGQAMVVTADRAHQPGEELRCSYGPRSNVLLYRTYGFTHPPDMEPAWSFVVRQEAVRPVCEVFLPGGLLEPIVLDTAHLEDGLCKALNSAASHGRDAVEFLRLVSARCRWPYEQSERLRPCLRALARARARDAASGAWWAELSDPERELAGQEWARLAMCEYLCLVAHEEAIECADGKLEEAKCLAGAVNLRRLLGQAIGMLRAGKRFELKRVRADGEEAGEGDEVAT